MDAKITKLRLSRMLSYDWLKIVGAAAALILIWILVFTMTATKVISSQQFIICNYTGNVSFQNELMKDLSSQLSNDKLTYEILEIDSVDMTTAGDASYQLLEARTATNELDLMFVSAQPNTSIKETVKNDKGEDETVYPYTYLQTFTANYRFKLHYLDREAEDGYFKKLEGYLNQYYTNGYLDDSVLDEAKIEADFRTRAKGDKRYKTEKEIQAGIDGDIARVKSYRAALLQFDEYLKNGTVKIVNTAYDMDGEDYFNGKGAYSINICPTEEQSLKLAKYVGYRVAYTDENGNEQYTVKATDMNVCLFDSNGKGEAKDAYRFEGLVYLTNLLQAALA